jgi:hypothetical protein
LLGFLCEAAAAEAQVRRCQAKAAAKAFGLPTARWYIYQPLCVCTGLFAIRGPKLQTRQSKMSIAPTMPFAAHRV